MKKARSIYFYAGHFHEFYNAQDKRVQYKIDEVLFMIMLVDRVPTKFLSHLEGTKGLYEIRVGLGSNIFRIFCCFDEGNVVILFNGFQKKTQKTPVSQLDKAIKLKQDYFKNKEHENSR